MQRNYKRKTYYVKNSAQTSFISRFVIISILGGLIAVTAFNFLAFKKIDAVLYSMRLPNVSGGGLLWNEMLYTNIFVTVFILIVFAITARGLYVRIHGPLKKMTSDINKVSEGDLSFSVSLRDRDEFKDFAEELNAMLQSLQQKLLLIKSASDQLTAAAPSTAGADLSAQQLDEIKKSIQELKKALGSFKI
jgi:methyl-accepting chemotaxis protein